MCRTLAAAKAILGIAAVVSIANARELSFDERVDAQEAIARVYYSHTLGVTMPFEQVYSRAVLAKQVRAYLRRSAALESVWKQPVTSQSLHAEALRIARRTRLPDRLEELYTALDHDAFLFEECVARATLTDRL